MLNENYGRADYGGNGKSKSKNETCDAVKSCCTCLCCGIMNVMLLFCWIICLCGCLGRISKPKYFGCLDSSNDNEDNVTSNVNIGGVSSQQYEEESRIIRKKKSAISKVLPTIFAQEIKKLKKLNDKTVTQLKHGLEIEINNDINTFLENYLFREYEVEINEDNYIGSAMIKFKEDMEDKEYIYIACLVKIQKILINDNSNHIKKQINEYLHKKLAIVM
eukprot:86272_1